MIAMAKGRAPKGKIVSVDNIPTEREYSILRGVHAGLTNLEISILLGMTEHVIKNHLRVIYDKLGKWNRVELALWYECCLQEGSFPKR